MPGAMVGDRWGHRRVVVAGLLALALGDVVFSQSHNFVTFIAAAAILGVCDFFIGSQTALLADLAPEGRRTQVIGSFRFATDAGALAGPIILASAMDLAGPQVAMLAAAAILASTGILARIAVPASLD
jgi:MFS family permease